MHIDRRSGRTAAWGAHNSDTFARSAAGKCIDITRGGNEPSGGGEGGTDIVVDDFFTRPCGNVGDAHILQHCAMA